MDKVQFLVLITCNRAQWSAKAESEAKDKTIKWILIIGLTSYINPNNVNSIAFNFQLFVF